MEIITGGVTAAKGFMAAGVEAGIKYQNRKDMAMVYSKTPCRAAGVFTTNVVKAAPVLWDKEVVESEWEAQAIVVNSGIANACTGKLGYEYCRETAGAAADALEISPQSVLICSTGVIGMQLPMEKMTEGVRMLAKAIKPGEEAGTDAAKAIMTTDTRNKQVAVKVTIGGKEVTIGGMCKGSGMIHPNMCTMLAFVTTDVNISKKLLQEALSADVQDTFNMVSVDGDTSTNDTLLVLANGQAGNHEITEKGADYDTFVEALHYVKDPGKIGHHLQPDKGSLVWTRCELGTDSVCAGLFRGKIRSRGDRTVSGKQRRKDPDLQGWYGGRLQRGRSDPDPVLLRGDCACGYEDGRGGSDSLGL